MHPVVRVFMAALVALVAVDSAQAQFALQPGPDVDIQFDSLGTPTTCSDQVLAYGRQKATGVQLAVMASNGVAAPEAYAQYFEAPAPIEITGINFHAFLIPGGIPGVSNCPTVELYVMVFEADAVSKLPIGLPLVSRTKVFSLPEELPTTLLEMRETVTFPPVMVEGPFAIAIWEDTGCLFGVASNSYDSADGAGEFLASFTDNGIQKWQSTAVYEIDGITFDADFLFEPIVRFELAPKVSATPACLTESTTVALSAESPFLESRFFNQAAFLQMNEQSYSWDFGDGSPTALGADQSHDYLFTEGAVYQPTLTATLFPPVGDNCVAAVSTTVSTLPSCGFIFSDRFE